MLVEKRDHTLVKFDEEKILNAILKAVVNTQEFDFSEADRMTRNIVKKIRSLDQEIVNIETIQDLVEDELIENNYKKTAKAFIIYRFKHNEIRFIISTINEYVDRTDWRVNANANQSYSLGGMILNTAGKFVANYWLNHVYPKEIADAHRNGDIHIHDLDMLSGYCAGWSLRMLLTEGFNGVYGRIESSPPKHLNSAVAQMINFLGTMQNEWAGAQAFSSVDTYLAPFVRHDKLSYSEIKQQLQILIFSLNVPSRWGSQAPFTNFTFDWNCPEDLVDQEFVIDGKAYRYGDLQEEMDLINRAFLEVMLEGDCRGRIFTFPIPTYNITKDFDWNGKNTDLLFELTAKYGLPYFSNFISSDMKPQMIRSMCCRLRLDVGELLKRGNGLFGSAEQTGSIGVVTINCARLGYLNRGNKKSLFKNLDKLLELAYTSLEIKRKTIQKLMDNNLYPFTKRYLGTLKNHFSTIGVNGINEMILNFTNGEKNIYTWKELAEELLDYIRQKIIEFQARSGNLYNLEATPAEGATYRFAREDKKRYPNIIQAGTGETYYTNSSQLPVDFTDDIFETLDHQESLQKKYTGGTVLHLYLNEQVSPDNCKKLVKKILENYGIPYLTITPTFSVCPTHGYISGKHETCPICNSKTEIWTRVMGYHRPVSEFNLGKKTEFNQRVYFNLNSIK